MSKYKILSWIAVILWMALIFNLSAQVAEDSAQLSNGITEVIISTMERVAPNTNFDVQNLSHLVRKNAHFIAYLVLGLLVINALRSSGVNGYKSLMLALVICVVYAISDEVHQTFVPGRSGELRDVLIDSAGAAVGIGLYMGLSRIKKKAITRIS